MAVGFMEGYFEGLFEGFLDGTFDLVGAEVGSLEVDLEGNSVGVLRVGAAVGIEGAAVGFTG